MQVVDFVLDDFCRKSREGLRLLPEEGIHELDLDLVVPLQGRRPSRDRQPSSASYGAGEVFKISGLYMTTDLFP